MYNLIFKDILLQKKMILFTFGYCIFLFFAFSKIPLFMETIYLMGSVAVAYMLTIGACAIDDKYKMEIIFNSLPVKREKIVIARYLATGVFTVLGLGLNGMTGSLIKISGIPLSLRFMSLWDIAIVFFIVGLATSVYFPLYFKFGASFVRIGNVVLFLVVFFIPSTVIGFITENKNNPLARNLLIYSEIIPTWLIYSCLIIIPLISMAISLAFSIKIYNNKEFN